MSTNVGQVQVADLKPVGEIGDSAEDHPLDLGQTAIDERDDLGLRLPCPQLAHVGGGCVCHQMALSSRSSSAAVLGAPSKSAACLARASAKNPRASADLCL